MEGLGFKDMTAVKMEKKTEENMENEIETGGE